MGKKQLKLTLFLALVVGLIFSLRNFIYFQTALKDPAIVYTPFSASDLAIYGAQIREVFEGKLFSGDAFSYETRDKLPIYNWLPSLMLGLVARAINSVELVFILGDFVFPIVLFVLFVKFIYRLTGSYWAAVVTSLSTLFLYQVINKFPPVTSGLAVKLWQTLTLNPPVFFFFNRLPPIQLTFIFFFLFIVWLYRTLVDKSRSLSLALTTGFLSGLLSYIYFYHWSASVAIIGICLGLNLLENNIKMVKKLAAALIVSLVVSAEYFYQIFSVELIDKQIQAGLVTGRFIEPLTTLRYLILSLIVWLAVRGKPARYLLTAVFLSGVALMNLQIIIGFTISPGHWSNTTYEPMAVITAGIIVTELVKRAKWRKILNWSWVLIFPIFLYAVFNQVALTQKWGKLYYMPVEEKQLYDWFNQNTQPDSVILTVSKVVNRRLAVLAHNYPYLPYGVLSQVSIEKTWERFNLASSILGLKPEYMDYLLARNSDEMAGYLFDEAYRYHRMKDLTGLDFPSGMKEKITSLHPVFSFGLLYIPDNVRRESAEAIKRFDAVSLEEKICRYRLDYIVLRSQETGVIFKPLDGKIFELVFQNDGFLVFKIKPDLCGVR